jgi:hypothetical protein
MPIQRYSRARSERFQHSERTTPKGYRQAGDSVDRQQTSTPRIASDCSEFARAAASFRPIS